MRSTLLGTLLALSLHPTIATADDAYDTCTRVIDGDTIELQTIGTVRLIGVDTPEAPQPGAPGHEAAAFLRTLVEGERLRLEYDLQRKDKFGRTLAYVYLPDHRFVNAEIVRQGHSPAYTKYPFRYRDRFIALEKEAKEAHRGIWSGLSRAGLGNGVVRGETEAVPIYVTRTGTKYHRGGCRYLARSAIPISLEDAARAYTPCSVCAPPSPGAATAPTAPQALRIAPRSDPGASGRCQATTKRGTQCKRSAKAGSSYCWQHGG
jgi:micrococcal nuclease